MNSGRVFGILYHDLSRELGDLDASIAARLVLDLHVSFRAMYIV